MKNLATSHTYNHELTSSNYPFVALKQNFGGHQFKQWRTQEFCSGGGGFNKFRGGQRERGSGGGSPIVRGSGGSCNLVQEISFHIVKFS